MVSGGGGGSSEGGLAWAAGVTSLGVVVGKGGRASVSRGTGTPQDGGEGGAGWADRS